MEQTVDGETVDGQFKIGHQGTVNDGSDGDRVGYRNRKQWA
jgi:hypothetical protein